MVGFFKKINWKQWLAIVMLIIGASMMIFSAPLLKSDDLNKLVLESILATAGFFIAFFAIIIFIAATWGKKIIDILLMPFLKRKK
ncbi:hypothetical protein DRQ29_04620 [bacterium]|nr:MAG: hypothetical protein DRQ29_04620 [bacterium]